MYSIGYLLENKTIFFYPGLFDIMQGLL